jgi:hypothetical protein
VLLLLSILNAITFGGESLSGRLRCLGFWLRVEGLFKRKMLANFAVVIRVASVPGTCKTNNFLMSLFPTIITKDIIEKNVALISFVGRIAIVVTRR